MNLKYSFPENNPCCVSRNLRPTRPGDISNSSLLLPSKREPDPHYNVFKELS